VNNQGLVNRTKKYNITNKNWNITKQLVTCTWQRFEDMFFKDQWTIWFKRFCKCNLQKKTLWQTCL